MDTEEPIIPNEFWTYTMEGIEASHGTIVRDLSVDGVLADVEIDGAGEAVAWVLDHGHWDVFDQDSAVTITVRPPVPVPNAR